MSRAIAKTLNHCVAVKVPSGSITLIISFGQPLRLLDAPGPLRHAGTYTSFVAGLHEGPALIEHDGKQHGIEVNLTPVGTHAFFGVSMHELTNTIVDLHDLSTATSGPLPASLQWSSWAPSCPMDAAHPGPELSPGS